MGSSVCGAEDEWRTKGPSSDEEDDDDTRDEGAAAVAALFIVAEAVVARRQNIDDSILVPISFSEVEDSKLEDVNRKENDSLGTRGNTSLFVFLDDAVGGKTSVENSC
jgi:hypothetical protein